MTFSFPISSQYNSLLVFSFFDPILCLLPGSVISNTDSFHLRSLPVCVVLAEAERCKHKNLQHTQRKDEKRVREDENRIMDAVCPEGATCEKDRFTACSAISVEVTCLNTLDNIYTTHIWIFTQT